MKIIESYNDLNELSIDAKKIIYSRIHGKGFTNTLNKILPLGKSVWIDSAGVPDKNRYVFENRKWKEIFESKEIKYYKDFFSPTLMHSIKKYINPDFIVLNNSEEFRYLTPHELTTKIEIISNYYQTKIFLSINTIFLDFNKLKYPNSLIVENVAINLLKYKIHKIDNFKYIYEIN